jgi:hypothetical protein
MTAGAGAQAAYQIEVNIRQGYSVLTHSFLKPLQNGEAGPLNTGFLTINQIYVEVQPQRKYSKLVRKERWIRGIGLWTEGTGYWKAHSFS